MVVVSIMFYSLLNKSIFELSLQKEIGPLFTITPDGGVRNTYMLKVFNKSMHHRKLLMRLEGLERAKFMLQDTKDYVDHYYLTIQPGGEFESKVFIKVEGTKSFTSNKTIKLSLHDNSSGEIIQKDAIFMVKR